MAIGRLVRFLRGHRHLANGLGERQVRAASEHRVARNAAGGDQGHVPRVGSWAQPREHGGPPAGQAPPLNATPPEQMLVILASSTLVCHTCVLDQRTEWTMTLACQAGKCAPAVRPV
jgi:hypothetical protein